MKKEARSKKRKYLKFKEKLSTRVNGGDAADKNDNESNSTIEDVDKNVAGSLGSVESGGAMERTADDVSVLISEMATQMMLGKAT